MVDNVRTVAQLLALMPLGSNSITGQNIRDILVSLTERLEGDPILLPSYPNTRNDGTPINILGTDENGNLVSGRNEVIHVGAVMFDTTTQSAPLPGVEKPISLNTEIRTDGFTHIGGLPTTQMQADIAGFMRLLCVPQFTSGGGGAGDVEIAWEIDRDDGNGFVLVPGSPVTDTIASNAREAFTCEGWIDMAVGDIVRSTWATDSSNINIAVPPSLVGHAIPSVQQYITHHGN